MAVEGAKRERSVPGKRGNWNISAEGDEERNEAERKEYQAVQYRKEEEVVYLFSFHPLL